MMTHTCQQSLLVTCDVNLSRTCRLVLITTKYAKHNSLVVCQSNEFSRPIINYILLLYMFQALHRRFKLFQRIDIRFDKHNFTAWVSCSRHTLDFSVQIFLSAIKRYIRCVVLFPNFILRPKFILQEKV